MSVTFAAVYENGVLRPLEPLNLEEGVRVEVAVVESRSPVAAGSPAEILSRIAALPVEGAGDPETARHHDRFLYGERMP